MTSPLHALLIDVLSVMPPAWVWPFAKRYVAGETLDEMVAVVRELNLSGASCTVDLLGEFVRTSDEAEAMAAGYQALLDRISAEGLNANISIKLSSLGLLLPEAGLCGRLLRQVLIHAHALENFVRIDMEDASCTDRTLALYRAVRQEGFLSVGVVLQARLRRTWEDAAALLEDGIAHVRLCKGIYREPRRIAYQDGELVNCNFSRILETLWTGGAFVGVATHDERIVWEAERLLRTLSIPKDRYEFQMLLGVDPELRGMLLTQGHPLRVYVPYGRQWHAYGLRRFRENPDVFRAMLNNLF